VGVALRVVAVTVPQGVSVHDCVQGETQHFRRGDLHAGDTCVTQVLLKDVKRNVRFALPELCLILGNFSIRSFQTVIVTV